MPHKGEFWAGCKIAFVLVLLAAAFLAAPAQAADYYSSTPIVGSLADDLIALGDKQYGPTPFIFEPEGGHSSKVRHQRTMLEGGEIFCSQYPQHVQTTHLGIRINRYYEDLSVTICDLVQEQEKPMSAAERFQAHVRGDRQEEATPEEPQVEDWLVGTILKTERSYCLGNFESREFSSLPVDGSWLREGETSEYHPDMFTGFGILKDKESGVVYAISEVMDYQQAREMGCAFSKAKIIVKLSIVNTEQTVEQDAP